MREPDGHHASVHAEPEESDSGKREHQHGRGAQPDVKNVQQVSATKQKLLVQRAVLV